MRAREQFPQTVCMVATVPVAFTAFMAAHIKVLRQTYRITLVTSESSAALDPLCSSGVTFHRLPIARGISFKQDVEALFGLWRLFRREQFTVVHSFTPKAGLLAMLAARLAGTPVRMHWFWGQVWATRKGISRYVLKMLDRVVSACATHLLADSPSQAKFLAAEGVVHDGQVHVLRNGSISGVDPERFRPSPAVRARVRADLQIPDDGMVVLFLGRLNRDKGIPELGEAFALAVRECPRLYLVLVGTDEEQMRDKLVAALGDLSSRLRFVEYTFQPESFMAAADVFVLPSHREGFPATVIEAAACEVPAIGTRIYGVTDTLVDGETGILVPVQDVAALRDALVRLVSDDDLRRDMGVRGRQRVERLFAQSQLTDALQAYYKEILDGVNTSPL